MTAAILAGFAAALALAACAWAASLPLRDVSIVDIAWGWLVMAAAFAAAAMLPEHGPRMVLVLALGALWALRLSGYIAWRHHGEPEDRRYRAIRERNAPNFPFKSLYLVFGLQAVLATVVALPLAGAAAGAAPWNVLDAIGVALFAAGFVFEAVADAQLARFKAHPMHTGLVMDSGLWRYSRHPNYFGECCLWWGLWLVAAAAGAWWTILSPLLMTVLLLKVSGVTLLEQDLQERRPAYREYVRRTNAFVPGSPRP
jgi:steroid 5-alpha reductase family enzyme